MKKNVLKIVIVAMLLLVACATVVNAFSFTVTMTPSRTNVSESSEFMVVIKVSNLDVGQNGINKLTGYLKYDETIFEPITDSSIEGLNGWSPSFTSDNGKIQLSKTSFVKSEEAVFQISFKTKSGVTGKSGAISYTNIIASNSEDEISATDISTTITVGNSSGNGNTIDNNSVNENTISNNPVSNKTTNTQQIVPIVPTNNTANTSKNSVKNNNIVNSSNSTYKNISNNISEENIPYTGVEDTALFMAIVILVLAIMFYVKYQKISRDI